MIGQSPQTEEKANKKVLNQLKLKREIMKNRTRQFTYFCHIKMHNTIMKVGGKSRRKKEQEVNDVN